MNYAEAQGAANLKDVEGCWESQVDPHWWIAFNGHPVPTACSRGIFPVIPYHCYIEFNGWPAGEINAFGGWIGWSRLANEDNFIDALRVAAGRRAT